MAALVQIMSWHRTGDKPLSEPMFSFCHQIVTHICLSVWVIIGSDNGLSPVPHQAIICNTGTLRNNFKWNINKDKDIKYLMQNVCHYTQASIHGPQNRYVKLRVAHAPGMPGTFSPPPRVGDPGMHHGTCVTWCMPGSQDSVFLWIRWRKKTFPALPAHAQRSVLRIW